MKLELLLDSSKFIQLEDSFEGTKNIILKYSKIHNRDILQVKLIKQIDDGIFYYIGINLGVQTERLMGYSQNYDKIFEKIIENQMALCIEELEKDFTVEKDRNYRKLYDAPFRNLRYFN